MPPRRNPYIWNVLVNIPDVRIPPEPIEDVTPNPERDYGDERVVIAFSSPPEFVREFTSAILSGVEVLYRDDYDRAQKVTDGWLMATEYPLPLKDLSTSTSTRQIIKSEIDRLLERLTTGGGESIYPGLPTIAPEPGNEEYDRLCAAAVIYTTWALDSITSGVQDATDALVRVTGLAKKLGAKGFIASVLVQLADEAIEALIGAAISNQFNVDTLSCLLMSNLAGESTDMATFGGVYDAPPYPDPILETIRAALSLWVRTPAAYAGWLDAWRQAADAPLATLPECPCEPETQIVYDFRFGFNGFNPINGTDGLPQGQWVSGMGFKNGPSFSSVLGVETLNINRLWPESLTITSVTVEVYTLSAAPVGVFWHASEPSCEICGDDLSPPDLDGIRTASWTGAASVTTSSIHAVALLPSSDFEVCIRRIIVGVA